MVEGQFGIRKLTEAPSMEEIFVEIRGFKEAHELTTPKSPQTAVIDGQVVVIEDQGATRVVTYK